MGAVDVRYCASTRGYYAGGAGAGKAEDDGGCG